MRTRSLIIAVALFGLLAMATAVNAAPVYQIYRSLIPESDGTFYVGSSSPDRAWAGGYFDSLTLNGVTRTTWPSGGGGGSSSFGNDNEIPFTNATSDDFDYAAGFTFDGSKLTVTNASTTRLNVGSDFITDINGTGLSLSAGGVLSTTLGTTIDISDETNLAANSPLSLTGDTLSLDTSGTWSGNAGTASALAANGTNASAGSAILGVDAAGNAEGAFDVWTEAENTAAAYAPQSRTLTLNGTANEVTVTGGTQSLAANRTWDIELPSHVVQPSLLATISSTTHATSTNHDVTGLFTFNNVTGNSWDDFCTTITGSAGLCDGNDAAGVGGTGLATSSPVSGGNVLAYTATGAGSAYGVATTTLAGTGVISISNSPVVIGGSAAVASITGGSNGQVLGWSAGAPTWLATTTAGTGLSYDGSAFNVNTSQNISTLSNLTGNGLVTTSGGTGALSVTAPGTGVLTALGVNVGSAGAFVVNGGALGTPASATLTNATGLPIDAGTTGTLPVARGGTGATSFGGQGWLHVDNATASPVASTSPTVNSITATSTTAVSTLPNLTSTNATTTGSLAIPASSAPNTAGQSDAVRVAYDTTSGNLVIGTTTTNTHVTIPVATTSLYGFTASTSPIVSGTTRDVPPRFLAHVVTSVACKVMSGTSLVLNLSDGTNDTNTVTCTTTWTQHAITSNNSWNAEERIVIEFGTKTGDTGDLIFDARGYRTSN